jgi:hypothetical protein
MQATSLKLKKAIFKIQLKSSGSLQLPVGGLEVAPGVQLCGKWCPLVSCNACGESEMIAPS